LGFPGFLATHLKDRKPQIKVSKERENGQKTFMAASSVFTMHHLITTLDGMLTKGYTTLREGGGRARTSTHTSTMIKIPKIFRTCLEEV
jgi:hypothetical protein